MVATCCALGAGCAGPSATVSPRLRAAALQARAGETAYLGGHAAAAVPALQEAVRLQLAAGDLPGAARVLVNLALAERAAGDAPAAAGTAARLRDLTPAAQQQARERDRKGDTAALELAAGTTWIEALLTLDRGEGTAADGLLSALNLQLPATSPWPGRVLTLRAEVALAAGRPAEALIHARSGQTACAAARDRSEEARAQRIAGLAHVRLAQWPEARARFLRAVQLEEALGTGERMARDLEQLAAIAARLGDAGAAELYAARARAVGPVR